MAYQKIGFKNGNVLTAEQLIHMEDGIINAEKKAGAGTPGAGTPGGTGTGLPSDVGAYKYMATDGEGKWVPVDRLAWKESESVSVIAEQSVTTTKAPYGNSVSGSGTIDGTLEYEKLYRVVFEGVTYDCICHQNNNAQYIIGNARWGSNNQDATDNISDNSPFCIRQNGTTFYLYTETAGTYTVSVEQVTETPHPIPAEYLPVSRIVFTLGQSGGTCNVPFSNFEDAVLSGLPVVLVNPESVIASTKAIVQKQTGEGNFLIKVDVPEGLSPVGFVSFTYGESGIAPVV